MKKTTFLSIALAALLTGCGGGDSSSTNTDPTATATTIKVVDGYIKNATVIDASGVQATELGNGEYQFATTPVYPITATGGALIDTNTSFDINMISYNGNIISPITTLVGNVDSDILNMLSNATGLDADIKSMAIDYIDANSTTLTKISQIAYGIIKDNLQDELKAEIASNMPSDFNGLLIASQNAIDRDTTLTSIQKLIKKEYVNTINNLITNPSDAELAIAHYKEKFDATGDNDDYDGDGVPNKLELDNGFNMMDPSDINGSADNDGDGVSNLKELQYANVFYGLDYNTSIPATLIPQWETNSTSDGLIISVKEQYVIDRSTNSSLVPMPYISIADTNESTVLRTYDEANAFCNALSYGGFNDWRLPTSTEASLIFASDPLDANGGLNLWLFADKLTELTPIYVYNNVFSWTSTSIDADNADAAFLWSGKITSSISMRGLFSTHAKTDKYNAICVRNYK
jgi:hypothetical protein